MRTLTCLQAVYKMLFLAIILRYNNYKINKILSSTHSIHFCCRLLLWIVHNFSNNSSNSNNSNCFSNSSNSSFKCRRINSKPISRTTNKFKISSCSNRTWLLPRMQLPDSPTISLKSQMVKTFNTSRTGSRIGAILKEMAPKRNRVEWINRKDFSLIMEMVNISLKLIGTLWMARIASLDRTSLISRCKISSLKTMQMDFCIPLYQASRVLLTRPSGTLTSDG